MTTHAIVRAVYPDATAEMADDLLWSRTGYPAFWSTTNPAREIYEALRGYKRLTDSGRAACDHCNREAAQGLTVCACCEKALRA